MSAVLFPIIKFAGAALVTAAGGITGFTLARGVETDLRELERLETALTCLSGEISYSLTPLPEALSRSGKRAGGATGRLFEEFGALTGLSQRRDAAEALEQAIGTCGVDVDLRVRDLLRELSRNLGASGHREQARYIELSIDKAKRLRQEYGADCLKRARLYRYLGLLGGAGVAIVLL